MHPTTSRFHLQAGVKAFTVSPSPSAPSVEVHAQQVVDTQHWSVVYMWGFGRAEPGMGVSITTQRGHVASEFWGPARSAQLTIRYGSDVIKRVDRTRAEWSFPIPFPLKHTGAIIVLFRDGRGVTFAGWATALPAGPFAAS